MGSATSTETAVEGRQLMQYPHPVIEDDAATSKAFQQIAASKSPGNALDWWEHCQEQTDECKFKVLSKRLLAGKLPGAEIADVNQANGQSGSVVMMLECLIGTHSRTLIVKTGDQYPAPDCDFYLQGELYSRVPEVFINVFAVQAQIGKGFTIVMEKFGNSFPGKPRMNGYDSELMLNEQLPPVISSLAKFHAAFWNDTSIAPKYVTDGADDVEDEAEKSFSSKEFDEFIEKRRGFANPVKLNVQGYTWLTDMAIANVMKGLGPDGIGLVGAKLRFNLLKKAMPSDNWETQVPLAAKTEEAVSYCSYKELWTLATQLRDMHGLPIGVGGILEPNQHRKAFFERPTKDHWTLTHNDAKFENVLLEVDTQRAKIFDFDLVGLGSGPMDLACFFISMWERSAESAQIAYEQEMQLVIRPYFEQLSFELGDKKPTLLHVADRYYGSGTVATVLVMNLFAAKGLKTFHDFLPRSVCFLRRCLFYWKGLEDDNTQSGRAALLSVAESSDSSCQIA